MIARVTREKRIPLHWAGCDPYNTADNALVRAACAAKRNGFRIRQGNGYFICDARGPTLQKFELVVSTPVADMLKAIAPLPEWYKKKLRASSLYGKFLAVEPGALADKSVYFASDPSTKFTIAKPPFFGPP